MNRYSLRSLTLLVALTGACGSSQPPASTADLAVPPSDLSTPAATDMATTPRDMTFVPAKLTFTCATANNVTAASFFTSIIAAKCSGPGCHQGTGANQPPLFGANAAAFIAATVGKPSGNTMNYITANDVDNSYLLYKVFNQQNQVQGGGGSQMPSGQALSTADMCTLVNWVRSGAK